eukprot:3356306-Pyramimonas_sp.AAC.1
MTAPALPRAAGGHGYASICRAWQWMILATGNGRNVSIRRHAETFVADYGKHYETISPGDARGKLCRLQAPMAMVK